MKRWRSTRAPASTATAAVASLEPSSTTITSKPGERSAEQKKPRLFAKRYLNEGKEAYARRQYGEAIRKLLHAMELDPENALVYPPLVAALYDSGDADAARRRLHEGLQKFPFLDLNPQIFKLLSQLLLGRPLSLLADARFVLHRRLLLFHPTR